MLDYLRQACMARNAASHAVQCEDLYCLTDCAVGHAIVRLPLAVMA